MAPGREGGDCRNCGTALHGRYCQACGQDSTLALRPLPELVAEWSEAVLGWETRSVRTLRALLFEPGRLTEEYAAGHRADWIHPLRLYLWANIVALSVFGATGPSIGAHYAADFVGDARYTQFGSLILMVSAAMAVVLPLAGACQAIAFRGLGRYYVEHLVFALNTTAFCYLVESAASLVQFLLLQVDAPFQALVIARFVAHALFVVYGYRATRRVYGLGVWPTVGRMLLSSALLTPVLVATALLMSRSVG